MKFPSSMWTCLLVSVFRSRISSLVVEVPWVKLPVISRRHTMTVDFSGFLTLTIIVRLPSWCSPSLRYRSCAVDISIRAGTSMTSCSMHFDHFSVCCKDKCLWGLRAIWLGSYARYVGPTWAWKVGCGPQETGICSFSIKWVWFFWQSSDHKHVAGWFLGFLFCPAGLWVCVWATPLSCFLQLCHKCCSQDIWVSQLCSPFPGRSV